MAQKKQKYYVVWEGVNPGVYSSWTECQLQIKGVAGAKYKSFKTLEEAQTAFRGNYEHFVNRDKAAKSKPTTSNSRKNIIFESLSVDAACSGNPGIMEYRGVWTKDKVEAFIQGPFKMGTNNIGEFLGLVHGLAYLKNKKLNKTPIYSDSRTAISWVKNKKIKTTLVKTSQNSYLFELMDRALSWLKTNSYENKILKWDTANWGEIPADFGRK